MWARFTVLNETPIASAIAGCVIPLSRSSTIWMRSRCAAGIFHRSAVFNCRICFLVHLTIRPPESDSQSESYRVPSCETEKRQKSPDSNSYGSGITPNPSASWASCSHRPGLRLSTAGSPVSVAESSLLPLRTTPSPPVAPHPASRRRSYGWLQAGVGLPEEDLHLLEQNALASARSPGQAGR